MIVTNAAAARCAVNVWSRMSRGFLVTSAALLITAAVFTPPAGARRVHPGCANAHARVASTSRAALQRAVVCLVNQERARHGLPGLRENQRLNRSAQGWTNHMVRHDYFSHGSNFSGRITAVGFDWQMVGENIATGFRTPAAVVRGWMGSPGHCRNILTPSFLDIGVGVSRHGVPGAGGPGTWTQDFGLPMSGHARSGNWGPANGCPY
jgi:uncharacterized protein YkwD